MDTDALPSSIRYVKNGPGGAWWNTAKERGQIHIGWNNVSDALLLDPDWSAIESEIRRDFADQGAGTRDLNALRTFLIRPSQHIWITVEDGALWWCTVGDQVEVGRKSGPDHGHFWLSCERPWSNHSVTGKLLATADLPGYVGAISGYRATVCEPSANQKILKIIKGAEDREVQDALAMRSRYQQALGDLIKRLGDKDFEILIDLMLARGGWGRVEKQGGTRKAIDIEALNIVTNEYVFVQVKSTADQSVFLKSVAQFEAQPDRFQRMIFAVHTWVGAKPAVKNPVIFWDDDKIAEVVLRLGLDEWVFNRI